MPGSIHISATQPPAISPLFLQVTVGKKEYSGNIEQDDLSFPVTTLRESMVIMLYNADRELISKSEFMTKEIVESGTMDAVFTLDSGGKIILQVQFLLNDDDRKRIQEMRKSAMKRKQQELLGHANGLNFPDSPLSKRLIEKISNIQSKEADRPNLRKSVSLDDLQERAAFSGINVDPRMKTSTDLLLQRGVTNTSMLEDPSGSKKLNGTPESKSTSSVKKMISTFEGTIPQGFVSETGESESPTPIPTPTEAEAGSTQAGKTVIPSDDHKVSEYRSEAEAGKTVIPSDDHKVSECRSEAEAGSTQAGKTVIPSDDHQVSEYRSEAEAGSTQAGKTVIPSDAHKVSDYRSEETVSSQQIKSSAPEQTGMPDTTETSRSHRSSSRDRASKQNLRENELIRTKRRLQAKQRRSIGHFYSLELKHSGDYIDRPLNSLVATSSTWIHPHICVTSATRQLKDLLDLEHLNSLARIQHTTRSRHVQEGTQENSSVESIASAQTRSGGFSMIKGWLVNQGLRAAIVVIACGAILFSTR